MYIEDLTHGMKRAEAIRSFLMIHIFYHCNLSCRLDYDDTSSLSLLHKGRTTYAPSPAVVDLNLLMR